MHFIYILLTLSCFGCSILVEEPKTTLAPSGYYDTKTGIETLVNACYATLRSIYSGLQVLRQTEQGTDLFEAGVDGNIFWDTYQIPVAEGDMSTVWQQCYIGINACNNVTHYIGNAIGMTDSEKQIREAEARFLRAYYYYILIMQFGDVHLTLEATEGVETEANRTPVNQILDEAIYPDLRYAIENLPLTQPDHGRIDVHGAKFFLSYVLLSDERSAKQQFDEAAQLAVSVIQESGYVLQENRFMVFDQENERNAEVIWSISNAADAELRQSGNQSHLFFVSKYESNIPGMIRTIEYGRPYARFKPTQFMFDLYDETIDSRYAAYWRDTWYATAETDKLQPGDTALFYPKYAWTKAQIDAKDYTVINPEFSNDLGSEYRRVTTLHYVTLSKFYDSKRRSVNETSGTRDWVFFRLAEAYLLAGEAYFRGNDLENAVKYINVLRRNAALPGKENAMEITASDLSIDFILDERARELCGEAKRWHDLKRLGRLLERTMLHNTRATSLQPHHVLRPIPQSQIDRSSNEYPQNEGW